jgi:hypothetical protein
MLIRKSIVAAAAVAVVGTAAAVAAPAVASAHTAPHTLKFTSVQVKTMTFSSLTFGDEDADFSSAGKAIGYDVIYGAINLKKKVGTLNVAISVKGGLLYGTVSSANMGKTFSGKVTGGTGAFKGSTGTITGKTISKTKTAVSITYK